MTGEQQKFLEDFLNRGGNRSRYGDREVEAWHFCDNKKDADELAELVLQGVKRGTASLYDAYKAENEPLPRTGTLSLITDWEGTPRCLIETIRIDSYPFGKVPAAFAAVEGEGDGSLEYWKRVHREAFGREAELLNIDFSDESQVLCEEFRVIYPGRSK